LVGRSNSEILLPTEICLFVSPVRFSGHCPPHTDTASQPCPLEKLKSSFSTELGWLHPAKRLGRPATGPCALAQPARTPPERKKIPPRTLPLSRWRLYWRLAPSLFSRLPASAAASSCGGGRAGASPRGRSPSSAARNLSNFPSRAPFHSPSRCLANAQLVDDAEKQGVGAKHGGA
jgi:hypothetical protein